MEFKKENLLLYLVTNRENLKRLSLENAVEQAIMGGVTIVQFREKHLRGDEYVSAATKCRDVCRRFGVPFIINDSPDMARRLSADGVHLGQNDAPVSYARKVLGEDKIIGISAHTVDEAVRAEQNGANYLGVGAVFGSATKQNTAPMTTELLKSISESVRIPVVAIGGIDETNASLLKDCNVSGLAVVSAILGREDVKSAAERLCVLAKEAVYEV